MASNAPLLNTLLGLAMIVEARDPYTGGHLWRVSQFAKLLAQHVGLTDRDIALCEVGGFLHDLGKIGVPDAVLNKTDRLSEAEFSVIRTHPAIGARLLLSHPLVHLAHEAVIGHHERPDGKGYPNGIAGNTIPRVARIVAIADAFDAMTSTRPYRAGMPIDKALTIIQENLGSQFDVTLGKLFIQTDLATSLAHIVGHSEPGLPLQNCPACGGSVVIRGAQHSGDFVYCRFCSAETRLYKQAGQQKLELTGAKGDAGVLAPDADTDLIAMMTAETAPVLLA